MNKELQALLKAKKHIQPTIQELGSVFSWQEHIKHIKLNLLPLETPFLLQQHQFIELKNIIDQYNREVEFHFKNPKLNQIQNGPIKNAFTSTLLNSLRQLQLIRDESSKLQFLDKIYKWANSYTKKQKEQYKPKRSISNQLQKPRRNNLCGEDIQEFLDKNRTVQQGIDPPQERLKNYQAKKIIEKTEGELKLIDIDLEKSKNAFYNVDYTQVLIRQQSQQPNNQKLNSKENEQNEVLQTNEYQQFMENKIKPFTSDSTKNYSLNMNENFEHHGSLQKFQYGNSSQEKRLQQKFLFNRMNRVMSKKEDFEICEEMKEWAKSKQKVELEMNRRLESSLLSKFQGFKRSELIENQDEELNNQENINQNLMEDRSGYKFNRQCSTSYGVKKQKECDEFRRQMFTQQIMRAKQNHGNILGIKEMEVGNERSELTQLFLPRTRCSSVSYFDFTGSQIEEVKAIKERLAKYKINSNVKSLYRALVTPHEEEHQFVFEQGNEPLFVNPFEKIDKKQKKKNN